MENKKIQIVECPRDAMQGIKRFIPTEDKINYINSLIKVGFDIIDFGSFVSPKAVPQMADTYNVISQLKINDSTSLLAIVLNKRGILDASSFDKINILGYPLSISEIFQKNNSNMDIKSSMLFIDEILNLCEQKNKSLLVYLSMAFGNPYSEEWSINMLLEKIRKLHQKGVRLISLADTTGQASSQLISELYSEVNNNFTDLDIGLHLHCLPDDAIKKIESAWNVGCKRYDVAIGGYGGCPFTNSYLIGNLGTEKILNFIAKNKIPHSLDMLAFENAYNYSKKIFN